MQTNPIMERIVRLSEQWETAILEHPQVKAVCWLGGNMSEYKMIKGLIMFHMSEESTSDDIFISCYQPFVSSTASAYGKTACERMKAYINSWNENENQVEQTGVIDWQPSYEEKKSDTLNFALNINLLAKSLFCSDDQRLVIAILPQRLEELKEFRNWIGELLQAPIDSSIRFMLYDSYDERLFKKVESKHPDKFLYLQPDMDLYGAMGQILENTKQEKQNLKDQDTVNYQQFLIKMTQSIGQLDEKESLGYAKQAITLTKQYGWYHLEALIHYFIHNLYSALNNVEKMEQSIDEAIRYAKKAIAAGIEGSNLACCQYLIVKGNDFLIKKKYQKAIPFYKEALDLSKTGSAINLQISMYQMLGICMRETGDRENSWKYLKEGWGLIDSMEDEQIKAQPVWKYYAIDIKTVWDKDERSKLESRFIELWGDDWDEKIKKQEKEQRKAFDVFN